MQAETAVTSPHRHRFYIDIPLVGLLLLLMMVSMAVLYSVAGVDKMASQALRFGVGMVVMVLVLLVPKNLIRFLTPTVYLLTLGLLLGVHFFGVSVNGAQRWLNIGITQLQPSELAKTTIPLMLAYYFYARALPPTWRDIIVSLIIIAIPTVLVFRQPDLGTAILVASSGLVLLFLAGVAWRWIIGSTVVAAIVAPFFWLQVMSSYQKQRVVTFLNPESDPTGSGYNIIQSKIAIGAGGLEGRGFTNGVQSGEFLPENSTDFIFAVFAEEFGFYGVSMLFVLYFFILLRGYWLAVNMGDNFSRLLAGALMFIFFAHFFINVGMVCGILPVVGLPLPLMSYGGTSILTMLLGFGLLMNLYGAGRSKETRGLL